DYLTSRMRFRCIRVDDIDHRNELEKRLIATIAQCQVCQPSPSWLGLKCYAPAVQTTGLWNAQHVQGPLLDAATASTFQLAASRGANGRRDRDFADALLLIPCSASKNGATVADLPTYSAADFLGARSRPLLDEGRQLAFTRPGTKLERDSPR